MVAPSAEFIGELAVQAHPGPLRVLDIAAGHGLFGIAVAKRNAEARVVALDWPQVLKVAHGNARAAGVDDRYELRPGSAFEVDFGHGFDVVLVSNLFHHFDLPTCGSLARKIHGCLEPGGRAITLEFVPNEDRVSPPIPAAFSLIMLAVTPGGQRVHVSGVRPDVPVRRLRAQRDHAGAEVAPAGDRQPSVSPAVHLRSQTPTSLAALWPDLRLDEHLSRRIVSRVVGEDRDDLEDVRGLSRRMLEALGARARATRLQVIDRRASRIDPFVKYLFRAADGRVFEAVRIPLERPRWSVCVSSQAGCALGCSFCETGRIGFSRNLEAWEMVEQVLTVRREGPERPVTSVVFQGQGEPFQNYDQVIRFAPPLVITREEADWALERIARVLV